MFDWRRNDGVNVSTWRSVFNPISLSGQPYPFYFSNVGSQPVGCTSLCQDHWSESYFRSTSEALAYFAGWKTPEFEPVWKNMMMTSRLKSFTVIGPEADMPQLMDFFNTGNKETWWIWADAIGMPRSVTKYRQYSETAWDKTCA